MNEPEGKKTPIHCYLPVTLVSYLIARYSNAKKLGLLSRSVISSTKNDIFDFFVSKNVFFLWFDKLSVAVSRQCHN
jgi:hypothetical protein